jgi:hypothetical protein
VAARILNMSNEHASSNRSPLDVAIERLYDVFARYPKPHGQTYSPYTTITPDDVRSIRERPLRSLAGKDLAKFAMKALNTWGDENELRYYLPRILELLAREGGWVVASSVLLKLAFGHWRDWPAAEQAAIESFVTELWIALLKGQAQHPSLAELALGASNAGIPVRPLVESWWNVSGPAAVVQLADLITLERQELLGTGSFGEEWSEEARSALDDLVRSPNLRARMEEAFFALTDKQQEEEVSWAIGILESMPRP